MAILFSFVSLFLVLQAAWSWGRPVDGLKSRSGSGICGLPSSCGVTCNNGVAKYITSSGQTISGQINSAGVIRVSVKYATAQRFQPPQVAATIPSTSNSLNLPPMCPQAGVDPSQYSEDCLYLVAYIPPDITPVVSSGGAPVLVWFHGGSYYEGSASDPALDGSNLAKATGSIVVVVQYRLGVLGYLPPSAYSNNKNLGVQDAIAALQYIRNVVGYVGGDKNKVTLAGQSSGGNMIRNLLGAPSASNLFARAILQSDPMDYGFLSVATFNTLQSNYYSTVNCGNCLTTSVATLLDAQGPFLSNAPSIDPSVGAGEPLRPVLDGSLITYSLTTSFPPAWSKNLLLTTTSQDAGQAVYKSIGWALPSSAFDLVAPILYGTPRDAAVKSQYGIADLELADIRPQLVTIGTDGVWRCPNYQFARSWANNGGNIWVGEFTKGATYPDNADLTFCTSDGHVCHEDDIQIVFGTVSSPTAAQTALITQVQARWGAFIKTGNPNTSGYANWTQVPRGSSVPVMNLGGTSSIPLGGCDPAIWGSAIKYDYQIYNQ